MTLYRISNNKVCIGLVSDSGGEFLRKPRPIRGRRIIDAPPYARWTIGKETYHVIQWFRQRGFTVQSKRLVNE